MRDVNSPPRSPLAGEIKPRNVIVLVGVLAGAVFLVAACGGGAAPAPTGESKPVLAKTESAVAKPTAAKSTATEPTAARPIATESTAAKPTAGSGPSASSGGSAGLKPCELLTNDQVTTVVPRHDGGFQVHAGGSLIQGVDAYQCSYSNESLDLLTVILNVAVDDRRFSQIKPDPSAYGKATKLDIADGGWLRGEDDDMKVTVLRGRTVIDLELLAADAREKTDAIVELARSVAQHIE